MQVLDPDLELHLLPASLDNERELIPDVGVQELREGDELGADLAGDADQHVAFLEKRGSRAVGEDNLSYKHPDFGGVQGAHAGFGFGAETEAADLVKGAVAVGVAL